MQYQSQHTALLVFTRDEQEEALLKSFDTRLSNRENLHMVRVLNAHTAAVAKKSKLPAFFITGFQQVGTTFGERLANAIERVFEAGFESVITIGNDCLSLDARQLQQIAAHLEKGKDLILGPAKDGGVYTIGIRKTAFHKAIFTNLPWQTPAVFQALLDYAQFYEIQNACLHFLEDADDPCSFRRAIAVLSPHITLFQCVKQILQSVKKQSSLINNFISPHLLFTSLLRAPPARF